MAEQNKNKGFIALFRSVQDHWIWETDKFSQFQAWVDLLLMANHKDNRIMLDGNLVTVERGSRVTSIRRLCDRWGWSNSKVSKFLNCLENDGMIKRKSDTKKTVITIVNYGFYQGEANEKTTQKRQRNDTEATQKRHRNTQTTMINNENNENNENKAVSAHAELFAEFWTAYPKKVAKSAGEKAFKALGVTEPLLADILAGVNRWKQSEQWTKDGGQFIPNPATFLNGRRWEDQVPTGGKAKKKSANDNYQPREYDDAVLDKFVQYAVMDEEEAV